MSLICIVLVFDRCRSNKVGVCGRWTRRDRRRTWACRRATFNKHMFNLFIEIEREREKEVEFGSLTRYTGASERASQRHGRQETDALQKVL